ncbi:hypothetical protein HOF92_02885 [bacterium]|nr:hypothetical protein [bacterium]
MKRATLILWLCMGGQFFAGSSQRWIPLSASSFHKAPQDRGFRKALREIPKLQKGSFHRFLAWYDRVSLGSEKMKIMKTYYENYSEKKYRLLSLIYFFHAFDPRSPICEKILIRFVSDHHFQSNVLAVLFASYSTLGKGRAYSFLNLLKKLERHCPQFQMPNLATLHFVDLMLSQELRAKGVSFFREKMVKLWKRELRKDTMLSGTAGEWIRKVVTFYTFRQSQFPVFQLGPVDFTNGKNRMFKMYGYTPQSVVEEFWNQFDIPKEAFDLPDFLPGMESLKNGPVETKKGRIEAIMG